MPEEQPWEAWKEYEPPEATPEQKQATASLTGPAATRAVFESPAHRKDWDELAQPLFD